MSWQLQFSTAFDDIDIVFQVKSSPLCEWAPAQLSQLASCSVRLNILCSLELVWRWWSALAALLLQAVHATHAAGLEALQATHTPCHKPVHSV